MCYSEKSCDAIAQAKHSLKSGETELARGSSPHGCVIDSWTDQQQEPLESASAPAAFVHAYDGSCGRHYAVLEHGGPSSSQRLSTTTKFDLSEPLSPFRCNSRGEIIGDVNKVLTRDTHNARPLQLQGCCRVPGVRSCCRLLLCRRKGGCTGPGNTRPCRWYGEK